MRTRALLFCVLLLVGCSSAPKEEAEPKPVVSVKVAKAERGDVELSVSAPATTFPREQANISARITSPIRELRVRKGDSVRAGQTLALLEDRDIRAQQAEAAAAIADAQASLEKTATGTLPADIDRARGQVETTQAALQLAQRNYERRKQLFDQGAIPQRDLNVSETELAQAKTTFEVAQKALDLLQNQSRDRDLRIAQSRVDQAKARLATLDAQLSFTELKSPFNGVIAEQMAYPGDMAKPDSPIFTVMDLSVVVARAQVPEAEAGPVRAGQACRFRPADRPGADVAGKVSVVNSTVDPGRRTVEVWCEIAAPPAWLRSGSFGIAQIVTGRAPGSILVPKEAVQFEEGTRRGIVMLVDDKQLSAQRKVECGPTVNGRVQILKGVSEGELVVIEGGFGLPEGTQLKIAGDRAK